MMNKTFQESISLWSRIQDLLKGDEIKDSTSIPRLGCSDDLVCFVIAC